MLDISFLEITNEIYFGSLLKVHNDFLLTTTSHSKHSWFHFDLICTILLSLILGPFVFFFYCQKLVVLMAICLRSNFSVDSDTSCFFSLEYSCQGFIYPWDLKRQIQEPFQQIDFSFSAVVGYLLDCPQIALGLKD